MYNGTGKITINDRDIDDYFGLETLSFIVRQPLAVAGVEGKFDIVVRVAGGGVSGQAGAIRHGLSRALLVYDENLRGELKKAGFLTRDPRMKERKKYDLKGRTSRAAVQQALNFPLASFPREGCDPCNTTRAAMPSWQCGTGFLFPSLIMGRKTSTARFIRRRSFMQTEQLDLGGIPPSCGDRRAMGRSLPSTAICPHKADTPIQLLAEAASARALQVLSFDLPGHGGRKDEPAPCRIQVCVPELRAVMGYAKSAGRTWACSPAAWEPASAWQPTRTSRWNRRCSLPLSWICGGSLKT